VRTLAIVAWYVGRNTNAMSTVSVQSHLHLACGASVNETFPVGTSRPNFAWCPVCPVILQRLGVEGEGVLLDVTRQKVAAIGWTLQGETHYMAAQSLTRAGRTVGVLRLVKDGWVRVPRAVSVVS